MRNNFDRQLRLLGSEMREMGALCEDAIALAAKALSEDSEELAAKVPPIASALDRKERDVENICLKLLLRQQPVARDLRTISAALKMITDMRRIGTQAADICEIALKSEHILSNRLPELIREMAIETIGMVNKSIDAFIKKDLKLAYEVAESDIKVDKLFLQVKNSLIESIRTNQADSDQSIDILMIAKYLEKIGDHANNIAEWVAFSITGGHRS